MKNFVLLVLCFSMALCLDKTDEIQDTNYIYFSNDIIKVPEGGAATVSGSAVIIEKPGNYLATGESQEGNIIIKSSSVKLYLQQLTLSSSKNAPIIITSNLEDVRIIHLQNSIIGDYENPLTTEGECATIKIKKNSVVHFENNDVLQLFGDCKSIIRGMSNATLIFEKSEGEYALNGNKTAISSDGLIEFRGGIFNIISENGDAIKSIPDDDDTKSLGKIIIRDGTFDVNCFGDAFTAKNFITIIKGKFNIVTQNGYDSETYDENVSSKGFKVTNNTEGSGIKVYSGTFSLNTADDAFRSNRDITIYTGEITIFSRDDAICAKYNLTLGRKNAPDEDLDIKILHSYEGLEGMTVLIYSGKIIVTSENDAINAAGVVKKTENTNNNRNRWNFTDWNISNWNNFNPWGNRNRSGWDYGNLFPNNRNRNRTRKNESESSKNKTKGNDTETKDSKNKAKKNETETGVKHHGSPGNNSYSISVFGGDIYVYSESDGIDTNGNVFIHGGKLTIYSKGDGTDEPIDHNGNFTFYNGEMLGVGSKGVDTVHRGMNGGNLLFAFYSGKIKANHLLEIRNENDEIVKEGNIYQKIDYIFYSSPKLNKNYHFYIIDEKTDEKTELEMLYGRPELGDDDEDDKKYFYDNYEDDYDEIIKGEDNKKNDDDKNNEDNTEKDKDKNKDKTKEEDTTKEEDKTKEDDKTNDNKNSTIVEDFSLFLKSSFLHIALFLLF